MSLDTPNLDKGSLERLGVALETEVPAEILKPNMIRAMRLRKQKPIGYAYDDVNAAREQMVDSAQWYIGALERRDSDVHRLGGELDSLQRRIQELQIELAREAYNAPVREALQQHDTDPEIEMLTNRVRALTGQLEDAQGEADGLRARIVELESQASAPPTPVATDDTSTFEQGLADDERNRYETTIAQLQDDLDLEQQRVAALNEYRTETDAYIAEIESALDQYEQAAEVAQATVPPVEVPLPGELTGAADAAAEVPLEDQMVAPVGIESDVDGDEDEETRDTDPEQPTDPEFFESTTDASVATTPVEPAVVAWDPAMVEDDEPAPAARNTPEPPTSATPPVMWRGKALPPGLRLEDLEDE